MGYNCSTECDTLPGSSGAPIFSDDVDGVLALHYAGSPAPGPDRFNYGKLVASLRASSAQVERAVEIAKTSARLEAGTPPGTFGRARAAVPKPGTVFRDTLKDGSQGPEMVVIPAGEFALDDNRERQLVIGKPFAIGIYEVILPLSIGTNSVSILDIADDDTLTRRS